MPIRLSDLKNTLPVNQTLVTLTRGEHELPLVVCSPTPGYWDKLRAVGLYESLKPPTKPKKDSTGKYIKINGQTVLEEDSNDPEYEAKLAVQYNRCRAMQFKDVLRTDTTIEFNPEPLTTDSSDVWKTYADTLVEELADSGLTDQEITGIITAAQKLANSLNIDEALKN